MISTSDLSRLPDPLTLRRITQALAALDAVLAPDWADRYYSFNTQWGPDEQMASMRDGSGDHWFALFCPAGVALVGLAHESPSYEPDAPKPWVFAALPGGPNQYVEFARAYYEVELALADVEAVYRHEPLMVELATRLNPDVEDAALRDDLGEIGYPGSA